MEPGELAIEAEIKNPGFSVDKWIFWRSQFKEWYRSDDEELFWTGRRKLGSMIYTGQKIGITILGEADLRERIMKYLDDKRKRTEATGAVSSRDMPMFLTKEKID